MQWSASHDACSDHAPMSDGLAATVDRILHIGRVVSDARRAQRFYGALGFIPVTRGPADRQMLCALGAPPTEALEVRMRLGREEIALVEFAAPGRAYPPDSRSNDLWFQHLAIVVSDMPAAYAALEAHAADGASAANKDAAPPWCPISRCGPQTLPSSSGGVQAFKFRDPDGHPLELLWFPTGKRPRAMAGRCVLHRDDARPHLALPRHRSHRTRGELDLAKPRILSGARDARGREHIERGAGSVGS